MFKDFGSCWNRLSKSRIESVGDDACGEWWCGEVVTGFDGEPLHSSDL
jgi:hypothetical protein